MEETIKKQPIQMQKVFNPLSETFKFQYDNAEYFIPACEEKEFVDYIAKMGAKRLADKNIKTNNPEEHRVLMGAYLENSEPEVIAQRLGIDLAKIRKEAMTKEKEKARVVNLEATMMEMRKEIQSLKEAKDEPSEPKAPEPVEEPVEEVKEEEAEEAPVEEDDPKAEEVKIDKRTKEYKESLNK